MLTEDYLETVKIRLLTSPAIRSFTIVRERAILNQGYFRVRAVLSNGDFLELVEFFSVKDQVRTTESYRYQWMDEPKQQLRKRWDNVEHFPGLPNFPDHVHIQVEENVEPSQSRSMLEIIDLIENELANIN